MATLTMPSPLRRSADGGDHFAAEHTDGETMPISLIRL
jgi:hypothetical protein